MPDPLFDLGFRTSNMIAGFLGGSAFGMLFRATIGGFFVSAFVGCFAANYFTETVARSPLNYFALEQGAVGFLIGLSATLLCGGFVHYVINKIKSVESSQ